jgi:hypothetical protein
MGHILSSLPTLGSSLVPSSGASSAMFTVEGTDLAHRGERLRTKRMALQMAIQLDLASCRDLWNRIWRGNELSDSSCAHGVHGFRCWRYASFLEYASLIAESHWH